MGEPLFPHVLIGVPRFELGTSPTRTERATRLRHTPSAHRVPAPRPGMFEAAEASRLDVYWECVWGGSAPRSVFDEGVLKAGCLDAVLGGHDPPRAGPHPGVLLMRIKPLGRSALARLPGAVDRAVRVRELDERAMAALG